MKAKICPNALNFKRTDRKQATNTTTGAKHEQRETTKIQISYCWLLNSLMHINLLQKIGFEP